MSFAYHLQELYIAQNIKNVKRCVPNYPCKGWDVLDVGCGLGQTLAAPEFSGAQTLCGIDPDEWIIESGRSLHPTLDLQIGSGESIPYENRSFDLVYSRVSMPYMNIPKALKEMHRVLKSGGHLWLTMHPWQMEKAHWWTALKTLSPKRLIDRVYVAANSVWFALTGNCFRRPFRTSCESVQTMRGIHRAIEKAGFSSIVVTKNDHFLILAVKS